MRHEFACDAKGLFMSSKRVYRIGMVSKPITPKHRNEWEDLYNASQYDPLRGKYLTNIKHLHIPMHFSSSICIWHIKLTEYSHLSTDIIPIEAIHPNHLYDSKITSEHFQLWRNCCERS